MRRFVACFIWGSLAVGAAAPQEPAFTVGGAGLERTSVPVSTEVKLTRSKLPERAVMTWGGRSTPAQIQDLGASGVRIWWLVSELGAHEERTYQLRAAPQNAASTRFSWPETSRSDTASTDLRWAGSPVLRYVHPVYDPQNVELTKKVFHHVFSPASGQLLTKGVGGLYSHHRGIFFGYNRCRVGDQTLDVWHAREGEHQAHVRVVSELAGTVVGGHTVLVYWNDRQGRPFAQERRRLLAFAPGKDGSLLIELTSELRATHSPVHLDGDRQHSGVQFRAAQAVAEHPERSRYLRPEAFQDLPGDQEINSADHRDLPWNALQFTLGDEEITVVYLSDPRNPHPAPFSERLYGRFGEFFPWHLSRETPLEVRYRWWIVPTHAVSREEIQRRYEDMAQPPMVRGPLSARGGGG